MPEKVVRSSVSVGLVLGAASLAQFEVLVLLGRTLSAKGLGLFSLVLSLASLVSTVALLGQSNAFARLLSRGAPETYRWRAPLKVATLRSVALVAALSLLIAIAYRLRPMVALALVATAAGFTVTGLIGGGILRTANRYMQGMALLRGWSILLLGAVLAIDAFSRPDPVLALSAQSLSRQIAEVAQEDDPPFGKVRGSRVEGRVPNPRTPERPNQSEQTRTPRVAGQTPALRMPAHPSPSPGHRASQRRSSCAARGDARQID